MVRRALLFPLLREAYTILGLFPLGEPYRRRPDTAHTPAAFTQLYIADKRAKLRDPKVGLGGSRPTDLILGAIQ